MNQVLSPNKCQGHPVISPEKSRITQTGDSDQFIILVGLFYSLTNEAIPIWILKFLPFKTRGDIKTLYGNI